MDDELIVETYNSLPVLRRKVLDRILVGRQKVKIAVELCSGSVDAVNGHMKEIYKNYAYFLKDTDPESKRAELVRMFYGKAPMLIARINAEHETLKGKLPSQFDAAIQSANDYKFVLSTVTKEEIPMLQGLGRRYFHGDNHLPTKLLEAWHAKDLNSFRKMKNANGKIVGFFIVLFLKQSALARFAAGELIEQELNASCILSNKELQAAGENAAYVSVVVGESRHAITNICLLLYLAKFIDLLRSTRKVDKLYAMAATESGRHLMTEHLHFRLHTPATARRDAEDFFEVDITQTDSLFSQLLERFPSFKHYSLNMELKNLDAWRPVY